MLSVVSIQLLEVIGSLGYLEIHQSQIPQHEVLIPNEPVQLLQFRLHLVVVELPLLLVVHRRVEHVYSWVENVVQHKQNHLHPSLVFDCLTQQLGLSLANNVVGNRC